MSVNKECGEERLYNKPTKERFLGQYLEGTQTTYRRIFVNSCPFEEKYNKDLYNFTALELSRFLQSLNPLTYASSRTNGRIVSSYISWAIDMDIPDKESIYNPLADAGPEWYESFVNDEVNLYLTDEQLAQVEYFCQNAQDQVIFRALFEGVSGKGASELINLRKQDVDFDNNRLRLTDSDGNVRFLTDVSGRLFGIISDALRQRTYFKRNNMMDWDAPANVRRESALVDSDYVLRNSITRNNKDLGKTHDWENVDKHTIYRRIDVIRELFTEDDPEFDVDYLSVKNIARSGMIFWGKKLLEERGKLTKKEYEEIAERFQVKGWWRLQEFVNETIIEKMYYGGEK